MATFADYAARYAGPNALSAVGSDAGQGGGGNLLVSGGPSPASIVAALKKRKAAQTAAAGVPPDSFEAQMAKILGLLPKAGAFGQILTDDQIKAKAAAAAKGILDPLYSNENDAYQRAVTAGTNATKGYTDFFANRLAGIAPQVQGIYDRQRGLTAATGDALAATQGQVATEGVGSLQKALEQMGAPNVAGTVGTQNALTANGTQVTKSLTATELNDLVNSGAAQQGYAAMLPGLGVLQGGQTLQGYLGQLAGDHLSKVGTIEAQGASLGQQLLGDYTTSNDARRNAVAGLGTDRAKLASDLLGTQSDNALRLAIAGGNNQIDAAKIQQQQVEENHRYQVALASVKNAADRNRVTALHNSTMETIAQGHLTDDARRTAIAGYNATTGRIKALKPPSSGSTTPKEKAAKLQQHVREDAITQAGRLIKRNQFGKVVSAPSYEQAYSAIYLYVRGSLPGLDEGQWRTITETALAHVPEFKPGFQGGGSTAPSQGGGTAPVLPSGPTK